MTSVLIKKVGDELANYQRIKAFLLGVDDLDAKTLLDTLEGETELHEALLVVAESVQEDEDLAAAIGLRIEALQARRSRLEATADTKRNIILMAMERAVLDSVKSPLVTMTKRHVAPKTLIEDEAAIPAKFWKPADPKLDKAAVRAALDAGEEVPGAKLSNGGVSLTLRVK